jgi:hypothetical protein
MTMTMAMAESAALKHSGGRGAVKNLSWVALLFVAAALLSAPGCGGHSSSPPAPVVPPPTGSNVQAITVNAGPAGNYANGAFTSVTVCTPGTTNCQAIDGILVDTGSSGLRILSSALTGVTLPRQTASNGNPVVECLPFVSGYTWGPVETADVQISGEKASSVPIQVLSDTDFVAPAACTNQGSSEDTLINLGANGIIGVGPFAQDCGGACVTTGTQNPNLYFECPTPTSCVVAGEALAQQVINPVALFSSDNNGVIIELPAAATPQTSLSGSLVFGIGTQSNNALGSATVYPTDNFFNFVTTYNNQAYPESFIDSGSNGLFFLTESIDGIPTCNDAPFFYCPTSTPDNLSAITQGAGGVGSGTVHFSVANADALFNNNASATVFGQLGGPNSLSGFDWGLPFFYGRNVYTAIEGKSTPGGVGPYWAY